jgi:hypothetical protein
MWAVIQAQVPNYGYSPNLALTTPGLNSTWLPTQAFPPLGASPVYSYPYGDPTAQYQAQSGELQDYVQFLQGQQELLAAKRQQQVHEQRQAVQMENKLVTEYQKQIDQQTQQQPTPSIRLPQF